MAENTDLLNAEDGDGVLLEYSDGAAGGASLTLPPDPENGERFRMRLVSRIRMLSEVGDKTRRPHKSADDMHVDPADAADTSEMSGEYEVNGDAYMRRDGSRVIISYTEHQNGERQFTEISFDENDPGLVSVHKAGFVTATFLLEEGRRHACKYKTPFMDFEMTLCTSYVDNKITGRGGNISFEYKLEMRGAATQRTEMHIALTPF